MSTTITTITDRLIEILNGYRTGALSADLTTDVTAVKKGQYTTTDGSDKPIVYGRLERLGEISVLAGGRSRLVRLLFRISGGTAGDTQDEAIDECANLLSNIEQIIMNMSADEPWKSAHRFGWSFTEDDENPEPYATVELDPGPDQTTAHFVLLWSCDVKIGRETLEA